MARGLDAFDALGDEWDALAARAGTPFLLRAWLTAWCEAFGAHDVMVATVRGRDDRLAAAAVLCERRGALGTPSNEHSGDWDAVAVDDAARRMLGEGIAALGHRQLRLAWLRGDSRATSIAGEALASAGYHTLLALRVTTGGDDLERDLDTFIALESSGWKGRQASAVSSDPRTLRLYRSFARGAAARGLLRLYLLGLDGRALAGDLGRAVGGIGFLIKTGFDDAQAHLAPGLVLRGAVLRACIGERLVGYDFLGGPDAYKVRWTDDVRPRVAMQGYRGVAGVAFSAYHSHIRPCRKQYAASAALAPGTTRDHGRRHGGHGRRARSGRGWNQLRAVRAARRARALLATRHRGAAVDRSLAARGGRRERAGRLCGTPGTTAGRVPADGR